MLSLDHDGTGYDAIEDPIVQELQQASGWLRPVLFHSPYESAAWAILSTRTGYAQAAAARDRLSDDGIFPSPQQLLEVKDGLQATKLERLHGIAQAALEGKLDVERLRSAHDPRAELQDLPGIGPFWAALIHLRAVGPTDVVAEEPRLRQSGRSPLSPSALRRQRRVAALPDVGFGTHQGQRMTQELYVQRDQPDGVPPLHLTGERTLPDVPEENYWYRRHLVVYEWIADRVHGRKVVDLACGEGYGSDVLANTAQSVIGVDANPEAFEHCTAKYKRVTFERNMVEIWQGDVDCVVFLQTIEHIQDPDAMMAHIRELIEPDGVAYVSTPNVLTLAPAGEERSGNPWHVREYKPEEYRELCERHFGDVEILGLFHARKLRAHQVAIEHLGWDRIHQTLHLTRPFYERFNPAISASDFTLRRGGLDRSLDLLAVLRP